MAQVDQIGRELAEGAQQLAVIRNIIESITNRLIGGQHLQVVIVVVVVVLLLSLLFQVRAWRGRVQLFPAGRRTSYF